MRRVSVTDLKRRWSELLRLVKRGQTLEVLERGVPVARLQPIQRNAVVDDERLRRLAAEGIVTLARTAPDLSVLSNAPVRVSGDAVRVLIEARGDP